MSDGISGEAANPLDLDLGLDLTSAFFLSIDAAHGAEDSRELKDAPQAVEPSWVLKARSWQSSYGHTQTHPQDTRREINNLRRSMNCAPHLPLGRSPFPLSHFAAGITLAPFSDLM